MDESEVKRRLGEIGQRPLEERAEFLDGLIDDLESALEETSSAGADPSS